MPGGQPPPGKPSTNGGDSVKYAITIGLGIDGQPEILAGPNSDVDGQVAALRKLTDAGGKVGTGKTARRLREACIVHTTKGTIKTRKF